MARVVVIGGSGHVGGYLIPYLVEAGHRVVNITRGQNPPYRAHAAWDRVENLILDREAEDKSGTFGARIADLKPDIVIDKICFTLESAAQIVEALDGKISHFLHTGTIWVHGPSATIPIRESDARAPFGDYGTQKSEIEDYLLERAARTGFPATVVRPGHIVGPGWAPLNPVGNFNPDVFSTIARNEELALLNWGLEMVHHVHADDVAQVFMKAINNRSTSFGEAFNAVSAEAVTLRGFGEAMYSWYGHAPKLNYAPFDEWAKGQSEEDAQISYEHAARSPCHSIEKAQRLLGYAPRYSSLQAIQEAVTWLTEQGLVAAKV